MSQGKLAQTETKPVTRQFRNFFGRPGLLIWAGLILLLLGLVLGLTLIYVNSEHYFYSWDFVFYQDYTRRTVFEFSHKGKIAAAKLVFNSMGWDYNLLFTVPLVPLIVGLGDNRPVFESGLAAFYQFPFVIAAGLVATRLIKGQPSGVFWSAVILTLLTPLAWAPLFYGYPDAGGAALVGLALWAYLYDTGLKKWWQIALVGFSLGLATLFRRHFAYSATAFYGAVIIFALLQGGLLARSKPKEALRFLVEQAGRIALTGLATGLTLLVLGFSFVTKVLETDYNTLYASYQLDWTEIVQWFGGWSFGWLALGLAVLGLALGNVYRVLKPGANFVALFGLVALAQWTFFVRQTGVQYTLHFILPVLMGLAALGWTLWQKRNRWWGWGGLVAFGIYLTLNLAGGLFPLKLWDNSPAQTLFTVPNPPQVREDYTEVERLLKYLRETTSATDPIYVVASSLTLNDDLLRQAEIQLYGRDKTQLNILYAPHIDSRDFYPLQVLAQAQYAVVVEPFQHHKDPNQQKVVKVSYDMLTQGQAMGADFIRLPEKFNLENGATAYIYRRIQPSSLQTMLDSYKLMKAYLPVTPGQQPPWIWISPLAGKDSAISTKGQTGRLYVQLEPGENKDTSAMLYSGPLTPKVNLNGNISYYDTRCSGVNLELTTLNSAGQIVDQNEINHRAGETPNFSLSLSGSGANFLTVKARKQPADELCKVLVEVGLTS